jgi:ubiquinone/menaquinone biosynthesis C-methylase UbiE
MISTQLLKRFYPDNSRNGTLAFYSWIRQNLHPDACVLNLGAGPPTGSSTRTLKGEVRCIIGADIDPLVLSNNELDESYVIEKDIIPIPNNKVDVIISDFVFEHVANPNIFLKEAYRVLKPGGSFFFRTPNLFHYVTIISLCTPNWFHVLVANRARCLDKDVHDPWPVVYRLNSISRICKESTASGFIPVEMRMFEGEPSYLKFNSLIFLLGVCYERAVNRLSYLQGLRSCILGKLIKPIINNDIS